MNNDIGVIHEIGDYSAIREIPDKEKKELEELQKKDREKNSGNK